MRVLFLTNIPTPYRVDFFNELGKQCELTVLFERTSASDRDQDWLTFKASNFRSVVLKGLNVGKEGALCPSVVSWLNKKYFDIFVVGGYSTPTGMLAIQMLRARNMPFVLNSDGGFIKKDSWITGRIKREFISNSRWWICSGNEAKKYLINYGADANNVFTYPFTSISQDEILSIVPSSQEKASLRKSLGIKGDKVIITVGRLIPTKGIDVLLDACTAKSLNATLVIVGDGPEKENLLRRVSELGLGSVHFVAFQKKKDLMKYYRAADVFVFPTRGDVWGLVVNEAMAQGLPVITTQKCIAGVELISDYENGFVVPPDSAPELSKAIRIILDDGSLRKTMARNNLDKIQDYTISKMAIRHMEIFTNIKEVIT